jgi:hypothetical protein
VFQYGCGKLLSLSPTLLANEKHPWVQEKNFLHQNTNEKIQVFRSTG